jgi:aquaporin related protein
MNINYTETILTRKDPLKRLFTKIFAVLPPSTRGHVVAVIGEFLGTIVFLTMAFAGVETASASSSKNQGDGVSTATNSHSPEQLLYIAVAAGFSLAITAWTFFRISGGLFNPAVSAGLLVQATMATRTSVLTVFNNRSHSAWH